jgi:hypothetical protein
LDPELVGRVDGVRWVGVAVADAVQDFGGH